MLGHPHPTTNPDCPCHRVPDEAPALPTVEALADAMRANHSNCTESLLQALGFPIAFQQANRDRAVAMANQRFVRHAPSPRPPAEPSHLVAARMRVAIGELLPSRQFVVAHLQGLGFTKPQIDAHLAGAIDHAGKDFSGIALPPALREVA